MNDIITTYGEIEVYKNDIEILERDYISMLEDPKDIYDTNIFFGLLNHIHVNLFSNVVKKNSGITNSSYNYNSLNDIFYKCYIPLTCKYKKVPTLKSFCCLVGISNSALSEVISGTYTTTGNRVNPETCETVKKWKSTCETALEGNAYNNNSIGAIFGLKAAHGWKEAPQEIIVNGSERPQATPEQIADKFRDAIKPELPMID